MQYSYHHKFHQAQIPDAEKVYAQDVIVENEGDCLRYRGPPRGRTLSTTLTGTTIRAARTRARLRSIGSDLGQDDVREPALNSPRFQGSPQDILLSKAACQLANL